MPRGVRRIKPEEVGRFEGELFITRIERAREVDQRRVVLFGNILNAFEELKVIYFEAQKAGFEDIAQIIKELLGPSLTFLEEPSKSIKRGGRRRLNFESVDAPPEVGTELEGQETPQ